MSDYTQITDFAAKDTLNSGNPSKLIVGAEHDAEFSAIATAITSKYDSGDLASQAQAEAGTDNETLMTPLRTSQYYAAAPAMATQTKIKSALETVNNSASLQADNHITGVSLDASSRYAVFGYLSVLIKAASDLKLGLRFSSAPTTAAIAFGGTAAGTSSGDFQANATDTAVVVDAADEALGSTVSGFIVTNAATTVELQWAQNSAVSEDTTLEAGSYISFTKIS